MLNGAYDYKCACMSMRQLPNDTNKTTKRQSQSTCRFLYIYVYLVYVKLSLSGFWKRCDLPFSVELIINNLIWVNLCIIKCQFDLPLIEKDTMKVNMITIQYDL